MLQLCSSNPLLLVTHIWYHPCTLIIFTRAYTATGLRNGIPLSFEQPYLHMLSLLLSGTHVLLYSVLLSSLAEYSSVLVIH